MSGIIIWVRIIDDDGNLLPKDQWEMLTEEPNKYVIKQYKRFVMFPVEDEE